MVGCGRTHCSVSRCVPMLGDALFLRSRLHLQKKRTISRGGDGDGQLSLTPMVVITESGAPNPPGGD